MSDTAIILMIVFALATLLVSLVLQGIATSALDNKDYTKARSYTVYSMMSSILGMLIVVGIFVGHMWWSSKKESEITGHKVHSFALSQKVKQVSAEKDSLERSVSSSIGACPSACPEIPATLNVTGSRQVNLKIEPGSVNFTPQIDSRKIESVGVGRRGRIPGLSV